MENAVLRSSTSHRLIISNNCHIGPNAHVVGCTIEDQVFVATGAFNTASWIYYGRREEGGRLLSPEGKRVEVPTAVALFPAELLSWPSQSYVERVYNIERWTEMPRGGHFAAFEQPDLLIEDIRAFDRSFR